MSTTEAGFYDHAMCEEGAPSMLPLDESPWRPLYAEAASWIPGAHPVVDLGCGTGRFADELRNQGHAGGYLGIDFSPAALGEARHYLGEDVELEQRDLRDWQPDPHRAGNTTYVCLEVLEHLEDDLELVRRVPPGHQLVCSVPNYESEAHIRVFRGLGDVFARYTGLLAIRRWSLVELGAGKAIHVLDTARRSDSW